MKNVSLNKSINVINISDADEIEKLKLGMLDNAKQFELGRYLLKNKSLNGYWTHDIVTYSENKRLNSNELEFSFLNQFPSVKATQERFKIFLKENQEKIREDAIIASIPSGLCGDLLYLDYSDINNIRVIAIDNDETSLKLASDLSAELNLKKFFEVRCNDAWDLHLENEFDLISSNGLNIYIEDDKKVQELLNVFYMSLKSNGKLVTSFLTYPPNLTDNCEWDLSKINKEHLFYQKVFFSDIIEAKWQCYSSSIKVKKQLESVGFKEIDIIYDQAHIFPTVVAYK